MLDECGCPVLVWLLLSLCTSSFAHHGHRHRYTLLANTRTANHTHTQIFQLQAERFSSFGLNWRSLLSFIHLHIKTKLIMITCSGKEAGQCFVNYTAMWSTGTIGRICMREGMKHHYLTIHFSLQTFCSLLLRKAQIS